MSTAIIKFEDNENRLVYCKSDSYPAGLGFELLNIFEDKKDFNEFFKSERFEEVNEIPLDIQYEYIIQKNDVHCQESWFAKDKSYHGGGIRHGGIYDLREWRDKINRENEYSYKSEFINEKRNDIKADVSFEYHMLNENGEETEIATTKSLNINGFEKIREHLIDQFDVPNYELTEENLEKFLKVSEIGMNMNCVMEYHHIRKDMFEKVMTDLKKFCEIDSGKTEYTFRYNLKDSNDYYNNVNNDYCNITIDVTKIS